MCMYSANKELQTKHFYLFHYKKDTCICIVLYCKVLYCTVQTHPTSNNLFTWLEITTFPMPSDVKFISFKWNFVKI